MSEDMFIPVAAFSQPALAEDARARLIHRGVVVQLGSTELLALDWMQWNVDGQIILAVAAEFAEKAAVWLEHTYGEQVELLAGGVDEAELERQALEAEADPDAEEPQS